MINKTSLDFLLLIMTIFYRQRKTMPVSRAPFKQTIDNQLYVNKSSMFNKIIFSTLLHVTGRALLNEQPRLNANIVFLIYDNKMFFRYSRFVFFCQELVLTDQIGHTLSTLYLYCYEVQLLTVKLFSHRATYNVLDIYTLLYKLMCKSNDQCIVIILLIVSLKNKFTLAIRYGFKSTILIVQQHIACFIFP